MKFISCNRFLSFSVNSLTFLLLMKLIFIRKPISVLTLKYHLKPISNKIFDLQLRKVFNSGLVQNSRSKKKLFYIRVNIQQDVIKNLYRTRVIFPEARTNFFKFSPFLKKDLKFKSLFKKFHEKEIFFKSLPSLQQLLILKKSNIINHINSNKNIIQYDSYPKFCFQTYQTKIQIFLILMKKAFYFNFLKSNQRQKGCYQIFEKKNYDLNVFFDLPFESSFENTIFLFKNSGSLYLKLAHFLKTYTNNFSLIFFYELCNLFTPRLSEKIFFTPSMLHLIKDKKIISKSSVSKNISPLKDSYMKIIVESNFRIYVYKKKKIEIHILQQFSEVLYKLPNLYVGDLTAKSISKAFKNGISGNNILSFIENNLHLVCKKIPVNVVEQIKIWEFNKKNNSICKIIFATNSKKYWSFDFNHRFKNTILKKKKGANKY